MNESTSLNSLGMKAAENLVNDIYTYLKSNLGARFKSKFIQKKFNNLYKQIENIQMVKTLWQVDKSISINEFYCPSNILIPSKTGKMKRKEVKQLSDLKYNRIVI